MSYFSYKKCSYSSGYSTTPYVAYDNSVFYSHAEIGFEVRPRGLVGFKVE